MFCPTAIEVCGFVERYCVEWFDHFEQSRIRFLLKQPEGLTADSDAFATRIDMTVIVVSPLEWTSIYNRLIAFEARSLFAFEGLDGK